MAPQKAQFEKRDQAAILVNPITRPTSANVTEPTKGALDLAYKLNV